MRLVALTMGSLLLSGCFAELLTTTAITGKLHQQSAQTANRALQHVQGETGRIKLEQARALFHQVIREARMSPSKNDRLRAYAAQFTVMEFANDLCRLAVRTCGGRSIFKTLRLEQLYRDSRCGSLMLPWTPEICMERLGKETLYGEYGEDNA